MTSPRSRWFGGIVGQHSLDPTTPCTIQHGFTFAVLESSANAKRQERFDDLSLRGSGHFGASSAAPGVLHGKVERCGSGFVFPSRIGACLEKELYGGSTSRPNRSVQSSCAIFVLGIDGGARVEEAAEGAHLPLGVPRRAVDVAVRRIVQWGTSPVVACRVRGVAAKPRV